MKQMKDNRHIETDTTWLIFIYASHYVWTPVI